MYEHQESLNTARNIDMPIFNILNSSHTHLKYPSFTLLDLLNLGEKTATGQLETGLTISSVQNTLINAKRLQGSGAQI